MIAGVFFQTLTMNNVGHQPLPFNNFFHFLFQILHFLKWIFFIVILFEPWKKSNPKRDRNVVQKKFYEKKKDFVRLQDF